MNIFKALSLGDGRINETNVTSFLSFVFNENNSFSASFFLLFLEQVAAKVGNEKFSKTIDISGRNYRDKLQHFTEKYTYLAIPEYRLKYSNKMRDVDILISLSERKRESDCCYFLIENKIKKSALNKNQCLEQFELFQVNEDFQSNVPVFSVLISPDYKEFSVMIESVKKKNELSVWLKWNSENENSIINIFKQLITLENLSEIPPIDFNTQYIIKSFIDYISTELSTSERTVSFSIAGSQVIEQAEFEMNNKKYFIKRYDNNMIRIFDSNNEMINEQVKPILRKIIKQYRLDVSLESVSGNKKNTQILGRDVIRALNNQ